MHRPDVNNLAQTDNDPLAGPRDLLQTPLPWEWFDFDDNPIPAGPLHAMDSVQQGGWRRAWSVELDGRVVPFKVFRRSSGQQHRPLLMLVHGMGLTIATFRGIAHYLFETHDLILPDYSGFSLRSTMEGPGMKGFMLSLWRIADALGVQRLSLSGNSLGGGLCLMAAATEPARVERMVLSNPACFPQCLPRMYRIARVPLVGEFFMALTAPEKFVGGVEYIGYVDKTRFDPELRRRYEESLGALENRFRLMGIIRHLPCNERDMTAANHIPKLGNIGCPVLLTWGEQDPLLTPGAGERLARALPNVTFEPQPDLAHMPHEEAPERVGPRWAAFLNDVSISAA